MDEDMWRLWFTKLLLLSVLLVSGSKVHVESREIDDGAVDEQSIAASRPKRDLQGVTTVLLVSARPGKSQPPVGLLTKTARTFVQDGASTEFATQIVGTTLDNGRLYARILSTSSRVFYDKEQSVDPSSPFVVYPSKAPQEDWQFRVALDNAPIRAIKEIKDAIDDNNSSTGLEDQEGKPSEGLPSRLDELSRENDIFEKRELSNDQPRLKPAKIRPADNLPTYTVKHEYVSSGFDAEEDEPKSFRPRAPKVFKPRLVPQKKPEPSSLATVTYHGFADFTTTVGDTVIVFSPSTSPAPMGRPATTIKGDATLRPDDGIAVLNVKPTSVVPQKATAQPTIENRQPIGTFEGSIQPSVTEEQELEAPTRSTDPLLLIPDIESGSLKPTGLLRVVDSTTSSGGVTTAYKSLIYGTYLGTNYAQVIHTSSNVYFFPEEATASFGVADTTAEYDTTATDDEEIDRETTLEMTTGTTPRTSEDSLPETNELTTPFRDTTDNVLTTLKDILESARKVLETTESAMPTVDDELANDIVPGDHQGRSIKGGSSQNVLEEKKPALQVPADDGKVTIATRFVPSTVYKTFTYFTTFFIPGEGDQPVTTSVTSQEVVSSELTLATELYATTVGETVDLQIQPTIIPQLRNFSTNVEEEQTTKQDEEIELIFKTLYTTYTYLTTFFQESTSSISSREVVETNVVTQTVGPNGISADVAGLFNKEESVLIAPTKIVDGILTTDFYEREEPSQPTTEETLSTVEDEETTLNDRFTTESLTTVDDEEVVTNVEPSPTPAIVSEPVREQVKTYYTTYTYFTTIFAEDETEIETRTEVFSNVVTETIKPTTVVVREETSEVTTEKTSEKPAVPPEILAYLEALQRQKSQEEALLLAKKVQQENGTVEETKKAEEVVGTTEETVETTTDSPTTVDDRTTTENPERYFVVNAQVTPNPPMDGEVLGSMITDVVSSSSSGGGTVLGGMDKRNAVPEDQELSESNHHEVEPAPTLLLQTSYTTFTYFTTMYKGDSSNVVSRLETVTNIATETIRPSSVIQVETSTLPVTYYTTFTYWTTFYKGGDTVTTSREETVSNVVTPGISPSPTVQLGVVMTYTPTADTSSLILDDPVVVEQPKVTADNEVTPSVQTVDKVSTPETPIVTNPSNETEVTASSISPEPTTYYTTYTYFTTSYIGNETILNSRLETVTSVSVPETTAPVATGRAIGGPVPGIQGIVPEEKTVSPTKPSVTAKTGLLSTIRSSLVQDGTTTHFATDLYGTYIDGLYAQVVQSSTSVETPVPRSTSTTSSLSTVPTPVLPTGVLSLNKGSVVDADEVTTVYFTTRQIGTVIDGLYAKVIESTSTTKIDEEKKATVPPTQGHRTGLVRLIQGEIDNNGTTTFYQSKVIGTSIEGRYAQIIESTSTFVISSPTERNIAPSSTSPPVNPTNMPEISPSPAVIQSSLSDESTTDSSDLEEDSQRNEDNEEDEEEDEDGQSSTKKSRLTFSTRKRTFTPVIRPFASRNRPTFNPKRKGAQGATTITRTDITPTITATLAGKGRFASSRGRVSSPIGPYSSTLSPSSSRRFSGRGRGSSAGPSSVNSAAPSGSTRGRPVSRISPSSAFQASRRGPSSIRGSSARTAPRGSSSLHPAASSRYRPGIRPSSTLQRGQSTARHEDQEDEANEFTTTTLVTEETPYTEDTEGGETVTAPLQTTTESSRRSTNPLLRFRRPLNHNPRPTTTGKPISTTARRNGNLNRPSSPTIPSRANSARARVTVPISNRPRQGGNGLFPPRGLLGRKQETPVDEAEEKNQEEEEVEEDDDESFEDDPVEEITDNDYEGSEHEDRASTFNRRVGKAITPSVQIRPFARGRRVRRQASQLRSLTNRFRRPTSSPSTKTEDSSEVVESTSSKEVTGKSSKPTSRYNSRGRSLTTARPSSAKLSYNSDKSSESAESSSQSKTRVRTKPTSGSSRTGSRIKASPVSSNRQFTLREKESTSSRPSYKRPTSSTSRTNTRTDSGRTRPTRYRNGSNKTTGDSRRVTPSRSSSRSSSRNGNRKIPQRGRGSHEDIRESPVIQPDNDGTITVTHYVPREVTIPVVNNGFTEQKNIITAQPSTEVIGPSQYSTVVGGDGKPLVVIVSELTGTNNQGQMEITRFLLHETPTTRVSHTLATLGGRRVSQSVIVPSTIYSVENVVSTIQPSLPTNAPLANILLSQLLLGQLGQQNPLLQPQGTPTTQYNTRTTSYVTTITKHQSTVIPLTFRGKEILTTLVDSSTDVITATEFVTDTVVVTPTAALPAGNLNSLLLLLQQPQGQVQQQQNPLLDPLFAAAPLLTQSNTLPGEVERRHQPADSDYKPTSQEYSDEDSDEGSYEKTTKSRKNRPRHHDKKDDSTKAESSVVTLYVSGRRPGEFPTYVDESANYEDPEEPLDNEDQLPRKRVRIRVPVVRTRTPKQHKFTVVRRRPLISYARNPVIEETALTPRRIVVTKVRPLLNSEYTDQEDWNHGSSDWENGETSKHKLTITRRRKIQPTTVTPAKKVRITRKKLVNVRPVQVEPTPTISIITTGFFTAPVDDYDDDYSQEYDTSEQVDLDPSTTTPELEETPLIVQEKPEDSTMDDFVSMEITTTSVNEETVVDVPVIITDNFFFPPGEDEEVDYEEDVLENTTKKSGDEIEVSTENYVDNSLTSPAPVVEKEMKEMNLGSDSETTTQDSLELTSMRTEDEEKLVDKEGEPEDDESTTIKMVEETTTVSEEEEEETTTVLTTTEQSGTEVPEEESTEEVTTNVPEEDRTEETTTNIPQEETTVETVTKVPEEDNPEETVTEVPEEDHTEVSEEELTVQPLESSVEIETDSKLQSSGIEATVSLETSALPIDSSRSSEFSYVPSVIPLESDYSEPSVLPDSTSRDSPANSLTTLSSPSREDIEAGLSDDLYLSLSRPNLPEILPSRPFAADTSVYYTETVVTSTRLRTYTYVVTKLNGLETEVTSSTTVRPRVTTLTLTVPVTKTATASSSPVTPVYSPESVLAEHEGKEEEEGRRFNLATRVMSNGVEVIVAGPTPALRWENSNPQPTLTLSDAVVMLLPQEKTNEFVTKTCTTTFTYLSTITKDGTTTVSTEQQVVANTATEERHRKPGSETAAVTLEASPTLRTEVFKTTYTYLTLNTDHPNVEDALESSTKVITNTVTAPQHYLDMVLEPSETPRPETNTYFSTRVLEKTLMLDGQTRVQTTSDTITQLIVTESGPPPKPTSVTTTLTALDNPEESMTGVMKTYYITYTYQNTFFEKGSTVVRTNVATSTDVVFEKAPAKKTLAKPSVINPTAEPIQIFATKTLLTTFTYFTTLLQGGLDGNVTTTVSSRSHVVQNVVTESITPSVLTEFTNALLTSAHHSDPVKNVVTGSTIIFFDEADQIDASATTNYPDSTVSADAEKGDNSAEVSGSKIVAQAQSEIQQDQPIDQENSSDSDGSTISPEQNKPSNGDLQVSNLLNLGSLGINSLSALGPVITAMAGLLQGKSTLARRNDTIPATDSQDVTTQRSPIYIPVAEFADGDIETAESQNIAAHVGNVNHNYISETRHKVASSLADGIPISPGEVITANSDVIIGKPGKMGPRPPQTLLQKNENIGMKPPPLPVPNIPVHPVLEVVEDERQDSQGQHTHKEILQILPAHQVYEEHQKIPLSSAFVSNEKPPQKLHPVQINPPKRLHAKNDILENDPLLKPPDRPNVEQYVNPNVNLKVPEWSGGKVRRPWSAKDPLSPPVVVESTYDEVETVKPVSEETRLSLEEKIRPPWAQKDPLLPDSSIVLQSSEPQTIPSEPIVHQVPHVIDRSTGQPLLVNIQPSQVANVVIPQGGSQALIFGDTNEPHISGQYFDDPSPYPEPEVGPGFVGIEKVEDLPQYANERNPADYMVPPSLPVDFKKGRPHAVVSPPPVRFDNPRPQDKIEKRPLDVHLVGGSGGQGHVHTEILVHHRPETVNIRHGQKIPPRGDFSKVQRPSMIPPRRTELSNPSDQPHQYIFLGKPNSGNEVNPNGSWKPDKKPARVGPNNRQRPSRPVGRPSGSFYNRKPIYNSHRRGPTKPPSFLHRPGNRYPDPSRKPVKEIEGISGHHPQVNLQDRPPSFPQDKTEIQTERNEEHVPTGAIGYHNPSDPKIKTDGTGFYGQISSTTKTPSQGYGNDGIWQESGSGSSYDSDIGASENVHLQNQFNQGTPVIDNGNRNRFVLRNKTTGFKDEEFNIQGVSYVQEYYNTRPYDLPVVQGKPFGVYDSQIDLSTPYGYKRKDGRPDYEIIQGIPSNYGEKVPGFAEKNTGNSKQDDTIDLKPPGIILQSEGNRRPYPRPHNPVRPEIKVENKETEAHVERSTIRPGQDVNSEGNIKGVDRTVTRIHPEYPQILTKAKPQVPRPVVVSTGAGNSQEGRPNVRFSLPVEATGAEEESKTQTERPPSMLVTRPTKEAQNEEKQEEETLETAFQTNFASSNRQESQYQSSGLDSTSGNEEKGSSKNSDVPSRDMRPPPLRPTSQMKTEDEDALKPPPPPPSSDVLGLSPPPLDITTTDRPVDDHFSVNEPALKPPPKYIPLKESVAPSPPEVSMVPPSPKPSVSRPFLMEILSQDMIPPRPVLKTTKPLEIATVRPAVAVSGSIQIATAVATSHIPVVQDMESKIPIVHGTVDLPIVVDVPDIFRPLETKKAEHVSIYTVRPFDSKPVSRVSIQPTTTATTNFVTSTKLRSTFEYVEPSRSSTIRKEIQATRTVSHGIPPNPVKRPEHPVFLESSYDNVLPSTRIEPTEWLTHVTETETLNDEKSTTIVEEISIPGSTGTTELTKHTVPKQEMTSTSTSTVREEKTTTQSTETPATIVTRVNSSVTKVTSTVVPVKKIPQEVSKLRVNVTKSVIGTAVKEVVKNDSKTTEMKEKQVTRLATSMITRTKTSVQGFPPTTRTLLVTHTTTSTSIETVTETFLRPTSVVKTVTSTILQPVTRVPSAYDNVGDNESIFVVMSDQKPPEPGAEEVEAEYGEEEEVTRDEQDPVGNEIHRVLAGGVLGAPVAPVPSVTEQCVPECRASKAEICSEVDKEMRCVCRPGFARMFPDRPCKPTYTYTLRVGLERIGQERIAHEMTLNDTTSAMYRRVISPTKDALDRTLMQSDLRDIYRGLKIAGFSPNPAKVDFHVQLSDNANETRLKEVIRKYLVGSNFSLGGTDVYAAKDLNMVEALDFDECSSQEDGPHHDCSTHATCFNLRGSYQCSCKEGWADLSENPAYPGRICSQAPLGCASCNNKGHCVINTNGQEVCECFPWHSGQRCQVNLKVLLIALVTTGAILLGLLAVCLGLACLRPSRKRKSGDRRAMIPGVGGDTSSEGSVADLAIPHHVPHVLPPPPPPQMMAPLPPTKRPARKVSTKPHQPSRKATIIAGAVTPVNDDQRDRSLTVMIPRAKYRSAPQSPQNYNKPVSSTFAAEEHKLISYLDNGPNQHGTRRQSVSSNKDCKETDLQPVRNPVAPTGALVSAGFQVSATVTRTIDGESTLARSYGETTLEPTTKSLRNDFPADLTSTLPRSCGETTIQAPTKLLRMDLGEAGSTLARSCGETTIQPPTKIAAARRNSGKDGRDSASEGHTMAERDLGSTLRLQAQHPPLYSPDRTSDRESNFDSL